MSVVVEVQAARRAWAAGAVPYLLATALGMRADGLDGRLVVERPLLPPRVDRLEVEGLRVGSARIDRAGDAQPG